MGSMSAAGRALGLSPAVVSKRVKRLEERLGKIRDQFQDKLVAQEQRIAEMDRELREKERLLKQSQKEAS